MNVIPFVHEGLGNSSYLIGLPSDRAVLIDPDRNAGRYVRAAEERGWRIESVFETHVHADFVTGAVELARRTAARVFLPDGSGCRYQHQALGAGECVQVDGGEIEAVASPGHTPEHMSYVLRAGQHPPVLFSGGSIIVGGAARTDLISAEMTEPLTRAQFHTLREAFASLPDETVLYPTHGGGSFCSAGEGGSRTSTLGRQRAENPLLAITSEDEFVRQFPATFPGAPDYFFRMRAFNQAGPRLRSEIAEPRPLSPDGFERAAKQALVLDVRPKEEYAHEHIPRSLSIPFRDVFAVWLGWLVPPETPLLFVLGDRPLERVVDECLLVGYERSAGWLEGDLDAWRAADKPVRQHTMVDAEEAQQLLRKGAVAVDVREPAEVARGAIEGAAREPLGVLQQHTPRLPKGKGYVVYCGLGDRASTGVSILERAGLTDIVNLDGGYEAWRERAERKTPSRGERL